MLTALPILSVMLFVVFAAPLVCFAAAPSCSGMSGTSPVSMPAAATLAAVTHAGSHEDVSGASFCHHADPRTQTGDADQVSRIAEADNHPVAIGPSIGPVAPLSFVLRERPAVLPAILFTADQLRI